MANYSDECGFRVYSGIAICLICVYGCVFGWVLAGTFICAITLAIISGITAYLFFKCCNECNGEITPEQLAKIMKENKEWQEKVKSQR